MHMHRETRTGMCQPTSRYSARLRGTEQAQGTHGFAHAHTVAHTHTLAASLAFCIFQAQKKEKWFHEAEASSVCLCQSLENLQVWQYNHPFPSPLPGPECFPTNVPYSLDYTGISIKEKLWSQRDPSAQIPLKSPRCQEVVIKGFCMFHTQTRKRTFLLIGSVLPG